MMTNSKFPVIHIKHAKVNNLNISNLKINWGSFYAFVGPSGSGKSSLAFDVLYTEAEQLNQAHGIYKVFRTSKPEYEVTGLPPHTIGIEQQISQQQELISIGVYSKLLEQVAAEKLGKKELQKLFCTKCKGKGYLNDIDPNRVVFAENKPVTKGALTYAIKKQSQLNLQKWKRYCSEYKTNERTPWFELHPKIQHILLYKGTSYFKGIIPALRELIGQQKLPKDIKEEFGYYINKIQCPECKGWGLRRLSELYTNDLTLSKLIKNSENKISSNEMHWLNNLNLGGLILCKPLYHLGSEKLRNLRFFIGLRTLQPNSLIIFDEPTAGLLPTEARKIGALFKYLQSMGHTVIVVDHSMELIKLADRVIAFGPYSGVNGGEIVFEGSPRDYFKTLKNSKKQPLIPGIRNDFPSSSPRRLKADFSHWGGFSKLSFDLPQKRLVCVSGGSGSGKTSLLKAVYATCDKTPVAWQARRKLIFRQGNELIRRPHIITPEAIGIHAGSTPATYIGLWDKIRDIYASTPPARKNRLTKSHFSFNSKHGRCPKCCGHGEICNHDHNEICPICQGLRYNSSIMDIRYKYRNIAEINAMTAEQAFDFFHDEYAVKKYLSFFMNVALDYLVLGQPSNSLSGGENQRVKIASLLCKRLGDRSLYIIDNPCRGIGEQAVPLLGNTLHKLAIHNTVLIAENNPNMVALSHWLILLGVPKKNRESIDQNILYQGPPSKCPQDLWAKATKCEGNQ